MRVLSRIAKIGILVVLLFNNASGLFPLGGIVFAAPTVVYRINGGGPDYVDSNGNLFAADMAYVSGSYGYVGGTSISFSNPVAGTTDDPLYQDIHLQNGGDFSYVFDNTPIGDYDITIYLMSPVKNVKKGSVMDILVEGVVELDDLDVIAAAGGTYTAHTETITSTVTDGQLNVDFVLVSGPVSHVSAIAVVSASPPPAEPDIAVSPVSINYGDVVQGTSSDQVVTISNVGTADLTVSSLGVAGGEFSLVSPPATPLTITPGGTPVDVTVRFSPTSVGTQNGSLDISSDDPDEGLVSVSLSGNGLATPEPDIFVSPVSLDHGDVVQGSNSDQVMTISNVGTADLTVTSLGVAGGEFSLVSPPGTPFTITPGGTPLAVTVRFSPTSVGAQNGTLDISSDDPDEGLVSIPLTGNGVTTPPLVAYRINSGGPNYVDSNGDLFVADQAYVANSYGYVGGSFINFTNPVAGTIDDPLYQDMHLQNGGNFSYVFDNIPSGDYDITIYLMAPVQNGSVMDIVVEGVVELDNLDVKAAAGGINIAHTETITSTVTDGQLNVDFVLVSGPVSHVSAIAVVSTAPPPETNPPTVSITSPADNSTVEGTIAIDITATDDTEVKYVELYNNTQLIGRDASQPYQVIWSTALGVNGQYDLTVSASDIYGNTTTSAITLNVNNQPAAQYDIVFILSDDYRFDSMQYMPLTNALIGSESVKFDNAFVPTPLCCPSRASILSGLYSHNNGVLENGPPSGGLQSFSDTSTIATWLSQGGYRTGLYGKYLNGYDMLSTFFIPPGWDDWHAMASFPGTIDYNYDLYENGTLVHYGNQPQDYGTDVLASKAVQFIETTPAGQPLFVYFSPQPYIPAPGDIGSFASLPPHRPPSYNESDVSDKPYWVQQLPLITDSTSSDQYHQQSLEALQGVDRAIESIIDALNRTGRLSNTVIIYTSDNGMSWGEHRWLDKKWGLYDESVKVPLWIRVPGVPGRTDTRPVVNVDLAPSFAEWAGVLPQSEVDGYSLVSLLNNPSAPWPEERLLEYLGISGAFGVPEHRFRAVHTGDYVYAEYDNGDREFYDLLTDPYQLNNSVNDQNYAAVIGVLKKVLEAIKDF